MIIYCTLYRKTKAGNLKLLDRTTAHLEVGHTELKVAPVFYNCPTGAHHLVHGLSRKPGEPTMLVDCGVIVSSGYSLTVDQPIGVSF